MLVILLAQIAFALVALEPDACEISVPTGSHPTAHAVNVPLDAVPAVFFSEGGCGGAEWTLTLSTESGVVQVEVVDVTRGMGLLEPTRSLDPNTVYTLTMLATDGSSEESAIAFTTGSELSRPLGITPELLELVPSTEQDSFVVQAEATASFGDIPGEDLAVRWRDGAGPDLALVAYGTAAAGAETNRSWATATSEAEPAEWCASVSVREFNGDWTESEPRCEPVEVVPSGASPSDCGCNGAGGGGAVAAIAALLALARRRR